MSATPFNKDLQGDFPLVFVNPSSFLLHQLHRATEIITIRITMISKQKQCLALKREM